MQDEITRVIKRWRDSSDQSFGGGISSRISRISSMSTLAPRPTPLHEETFNPYGSSRSHGRNEVDHQPHELNVGRRHR